MRRVRELLESVVVVAVLLTVLLVVASAYLAPEGAFLLRDLAGGAGGALSAVAGALAD